MRVHAPSCDCFECSDEHLKTLNRKYRKGFEVMPTGYTDHFSYSVAELIGAKLRSNTVMVNVYTSPTGSLIRSVPIGQTIGTIESWVERPNNEGGKTVWYQLKEGGFVPHFEHRFDENFLTETLNAYNTERENEVKEKTQKRLDQNTNPFYRFGKNFDFSNILGGVKWVVIVLGVILLLSMFTSAKRALA